LRAEVLIRTPDQRLRVFVRSTVGEAGELAVERRAVERAISALRLTPVLFELGARPYPPRELYRAYVAQSDVFIGLYWLRYGRVGPGMEISGLEEELELARAGALPRLLYVKTPAPDREVRLTELLDRIKRDASDSYRYFRTPTELGRLVRDDLATLLSEQFAATRQAYDPESVPLPSPRSRGRGPRPLPVGTTSLVGREQAIELVLAGIGQALDADLGTGAPLEALVEQLGDGRWLLVLDNLEQIIEVAGDLEALLARCGGVAILATSRTVLGLRAEREFPVPPLPLPADPATAPVDVLLTSSPAVALFVDRARAVRYDFALTEGNAAAVMEICRRLEGLPLAIELAAARTRLLEPGALLRRLSRSLDALGTGAVDLPERQRTLRATVAWSVGLLDEAERSLLETVAVFVDGWTVEAAADIAGLDEDRALELSEALARHSLTYLDRTDLGPRSRMLDTIREFVAERLAARPDVAEIRRRHAGHFRALAEQADRPLRSIDQSEWVERLQAEVGNLAAAVEWCLANDRAPLPHLFRVLCTFWMLRDHSREARSWIGQSCPPPTRSAPRREPSW
jgi:predicted ATPase